MSEYRPLKTKIWHDNWFLTLNKEEKLFWIFLLTNEYVHISGLYELPETLISPLTGIENYAKILTKFTYSGKILYKDGWVYIINYFKNQAKQINKKDNIYKAREKYFAENALILAKLGIENEDPYKPLQAPTKPLPKDFKEFKELKDIKDLKDLQPAVADEVNQIMDLFYKVNPTINYGNTTQRKAIEFVLAKWGLEACKSMVEKALAIQGQPYAPVITTPIHFKDKIAQVKIFLEKQNPNKGISILQV